MGERVKTRTEAEQGGGGRAKVVVLESERMVVRAAVVGDKPEIVLGTWEGAGALRRRPDMGPTAGDGQVGWGRWQWDLEVLAGGDGTAVTALGRSDDVVHVIGLILRPPGEWLEVTETLSSDCGALPSLAAFESRWELSGGGEVQEVFTPSLVPLEGDLVGRHMLRAPVMVAESVGMGVALAVDIEVLEEVGGRPGGVGTAQAG